MSEQGHRVTSLGEVAEAVGGVLRGDASIRLLGATHDSRKVEQGWLFCAVEGDQHDGADFADEALAAGAAALLVQRGDVGAGHPAVVVADVRKAMARAAALIHGEPSQQLAMVGVTGTNGKTTVVSLLGDLLRQVGRPTKVLGTLTGSRTTPESTDLQELLAGFVAEGTTHVVMEVSSHALSLHRVDGIRFDVAVFTNLGIDHLDFHGNPEAYFSAKAKLFEPDRCELAVLNLDDVHGRLLSDTAEVPVRGYSVDSLDDLEMDVNGSRFTWRGVPLSLALPGRHNVANALATAEAAVALGLDPQQVANGLARVATVPGRFEVLDSPPGMATVVVDYAHTPDALESVLDAARALVQPERRLWVVFGNGGDRDRDKRPLMGQVATAGTDRVIVTTDNPRTEDPQGIIEAILRGCDDSVVVEPDRRTAIRAALAESGSGDVVVIAGKGHETGQQFADRTEPFDDRAVAAEELRSLGGQR